MGIHSQQQSSRRRRQIPPPPRRQCCFSFAAYARSLMDHLRRCGIRVEPGLTDMELGHLESRLGLVFPPDLRAILSEGLPTGSSFPDWRHDSPASLQARIQLPVTDLCGLVRRNRFWWQRWGDRPGSDEEAAEMAAAALARAPTLVPVYGNCYIPSSGSSGNPVLLVQSGQVAVVGNDVADFFEREVFHGEDEEEDEDRDGNSQEDQSSMVSKRSTGRSSTDGSGDKDRFLSSLWIKSLDLSAAFRRKKSGSGGVGTRSAEASPRPSVSSTASSGGAAGELPRRSLDVVSRRKSSNHPAKGVALEALLGFTMAAPAWVAKTPRHVDFWSDLCNQQPQIDDPETRKSMVLPRLVQALPPPSPIALASTVAADAPTLDLAPTPVLPVKSPNPVLPTPDAAGSRHNPISDRSKTPRVNGLIQSEQRQRSSSWLHGYLDDMAGRLRIAGWKEDEICEMMVPSSIEDYPDSFHAIVPSARQSRQAVIQGLVSKVHELSDSLKRSGWSVQDVAEAFNATSATTSRVLSPVGCIAAR